MPKTLILTNANDYSSTTVIKWLLYLKKTYTRINNGEVLEIQNITITDDGVGFNLSHHAQAIDLSQYDSYWYRRGNFRIHPMPQFIHQDAALNKAINQQLDRERKAIIDFLHQKLESKKHINSALKAEVNKLHALTIANEIGLKIPNTHLLSRKQDLIELLKTNTHITKGIQESLTLEYRQGKENAIYYCMTAEFKNEQLRLIPENFSSTKFQNKIQKALELRVFIFNKKCFTMAIFSQNNPKTETDFRRYDRQKPNRNVPYQLPIEIEKKLHLLCKGLRLNSGSADLILDQQGQYIFLEINPVGQFGMVSHPCNYYLEKKIAQYL